MLKDAVGMLKKKELSPWRARAAYIITTVDFLLSPVRIQGMERLLWKDRREIRQVLCTEYGRMDTEFRQRVKVCLTLDAKNSVTKEQRRESAGSHGQ